MDKINDDHFSKDRRVVVLVCNDGHRITAPVSQPTVEHDFLVEHLLCMRFVNVSGAVPAMCMPHMNGVVDAFKAQYRVFLMRRAVRKPECQHRYSAPRAVVDNFNMLRWIGLAWQHVSSATMQRSWWRAGCVPDTWTSSMGHLHGTFAAGMYEPLVSTTVDLQVLIEEFKNELGTFMTACEYVDCDKTLLEEAGIVFEPVSSGSSGGGVEMCIPEGPLLSDPRSRRRVIRSVTHAYTRHADELGIPLAGVPSEVVALNQELAVQFSGFSLPPNFRSPSSARSLRYHPPLSCPCPPAACMHGMGAARTTMNERVANTMLARMVYQCTVAANSLDAIRCLQTHPFDLVLMDVQVSCAMRCKCVGGAWTSVGVQVRGVN
ncbi:unnamed protein product [Closterium sp. NIES-64]|nr:unnamed protein product [Closterium sp. NIES-64]